MKRGNGTIMESLESGFGLKRLNLKFSIHFVTLLQHQNKLRNADNQSRIYMKNIQNRENKRKKKKKKKKNEEITAAMEKPVDPLPERQLCEYEKICQDIIRERREAMVVISLRIYRKQRQIQACIRKMPIKKCCQKSMRRKKSHPNLKLNQHFLYCTFAALRQTKRR